MTVTVNADNFVLSIAVFAFVFSCRDFVSWCLAVYIAAAGSFKMINVNDGRHVVLSSFLIQSVKNLKVCHGISLMAH